MTDPPLITSFFKKVINDKNLFYKRFLRNKDFTNLSSIIETTKQRYFSKNIKKLSHTNISPQTYWSILKKFLAVKKAPCIPLTFMK